MIWMSRQCSCWRSGVEYDSLTIGNGSGSVILCRMLSKVRGQQHYHCTAEEQNAPWHDQVLNEEMNNILEELPRAITMTVYSAMMFHGHGTVLRRNGLGISEPLINP
jgi:hypothetical protein